jgi:hypothetical protein
VVANAESVVVERLVALQEWEAALCAYELEAARFFAAGYLGQPDHLPAVPEALDQSELGSLLALRCAEERAMHRYVGMCGGGADAS